MQFLLKRSLLVDLQLTFNIVDIRDPIPVPEKERMPLTEVQEFNLHVDHRAVDRAEFDKKVTFSILHSLTRSPDIYEI